MTTVPVIGICCGLPGALSVMTRVALCAPRLVARKLTKISQLLPAARLGGQRLRKGKVSKVESVPGDSETLVIFNVVDPVLVTVSVSRPAPPSVTFPKFRLLGESVMAG